MTDSVTILRCALCKRSFSYIPTPDDKCAPGSERQICDTCAELLIEDRKQYDLNPDIQ